MSTLALTRYLDAARFEVELIEDVLSRLDGGESPESVLDHLMEVEPSGSLFRYVVWERVTGSVRNIE